jgi:hypothetical protein
VFILEHHFASKSLATVPEKCSIAHPGKEVQDKTTVHGLVTELRDTGSVLSVTSAHRATKQLKLRQ